MSLRSKITEYALAHAGNLLPATVLAVFAVATAAAAHDYEAVQYLGYALAGIGLLFSLAALVGMGKNTVGHPTLFVLIFFWAKLILALVYGVLILGGIELLWRIPHFPDDATLGIVASASTMQLVLGVFLYYGVKAKVLARRVDPGWLLRWMFRK